MQGVGVEPTKALSHRILSPAHLTTLLSLHIRKPWFSYQLSFKFAIITPIKSFINAQF